MAWSNASLAVLLGIGGGAACWCLYRSRARSAQRELVVGHRGLELDGLPLSLADALAACSACKAVRLHVAPGAPGAVIRALTDELRRRAVRVELSHREVAGDPQSPGESESHALASELAQFAATVASVAREVQSTPAPHGLARGRFGARKVFIAAVRRGLDKTAYGEVPRGEIEQMLAASARLGLLELACAELVDAMDPAELRDSEIEDGGRTYHFVIAPERTVTGCGVS